MERAETTAALSPPIRLVLSALGLAIVAGAALINFKLLASGMAAMVDGGDYIGGFKIADIAALVIILVELSMGLFLMEAWGITRLLPDQALPEQMRPRMVAVSLLIIVMLALVEAGQMYMQDLLLAKGAALNTALQSDVGGDLFLPMPLWARMGLAFCLPFAIAFAAVPLDALIRTLRAPRV